MGDGISLNDVNKMLKKAIYQLDEGVKKSAETTKELTGIVTVVQNLHDNAATHGTAPAIAALKEIASTRSTATLEAVTALLKAVAASESNATYEAIAALLKANAAPGPIPIVEPTVAPPVPPAPGTAPITQTAPRAPPGNRSILGHPRNPVTKNTLANAPNRDNPELQLYEFEYFKQMGEAKEKQGADMETRKRQAEDQSFSGTAKKGRGSK